MSKKLNETLNPNSLRGLISPIVSIDQYKSKIGEEDKAVVIAFTVKDKYPAQDLSTFIERGNSDYVDVELGVGPSTDESEYHVYVEIHRNSKLFDTVDGLLDAVKNLDEDIEAWMFTSYKQTFPKPFSKENFDKQVISDPYEYVTTYNKDAKQISERIKFLNNYK
jgi:hypothetical protein